MEYFWKQYEDLPAELGYERFSMPHLCELIIIAALITAFAWWFSKQKQDRQDRILFVIPFLMVLLELCKDGFLLSAHHFGVGYLPLHLCSLGLFVFLLSALSKTAKWKGIFGEIAVILILPGSIAALLFPDWVHLYPVFNFMNLHGFVWHGLLVLYPILMIRRGLTNLTIRHIHYVYIFLAIVTPPVYFFDRAFDCNYMFVNWPPKGTPLAWIAQITGTDFYLTGYAIFSIVVICLIYLIIHLAKASRKN